MSRQQEHHQADGNTVEWTERVLLVHSPAHTQQQQRGLEQRLKRATQKLNALTPAVGRGKRQIRSLLDLQQKANAILQLHHVEGCIEYSYEYHPAVKQQKERYHITEVTLIEAAVEEKQQRFGWRVYVTNASLEEGSSQLLVMRLKPLAQHMILHLPMKP